jgi:hypothetical protein
MQRHIRVLGRMAAACAVLAVAVPLGAQTPAAEHVPTKDDPIRFSAFAVSMQGGRAGVVEIVIERWTGDDERKGLLELVGGTSFKDGGQDKLLKALQDVKVRTGYIRTPNSLGWDLKYAKEFHQADGTRQIVVATDKPVSFFAARNSSRSLDYPFTFVEMRIKPPDAKGEAKGEGKLLAATAVSYATGKLELENYGQEPVRLTTITQEKDKKKKK